MTDSEAHRANVVFLRAYLLLGLEGDCDEPGGAECRRVHREWVEAGMPTDVEAFIRLHANQSGGSR